VAGNCNAVATWVAPVATDNCGVTITSTHNSGDSFPIGVTTVTYTATDAAGNSVNCSFTVTVTGTNAPVITNCPGDITVAAAFNSCLSQVYWAAIVATDNCSSAGVTVTSTYPSGYLFPVGVTPVVITATDADGNVTTCTFNVTVQDNQAPTFFACTSNKVVSNAPGTCAAPVFWDMPNAFDNCSGITYTSTHNSGDTFPVGVTTVTLTATDASGNATNCTFTVTVNDTQAPVIAGMPANITIQATSGQCSATATWTEPTATDNCNLISFVSVPANGTVLPTGTTTVVYTATDASGNVSTSSFTVTVIDSEAPVAANCPADIIAAATATACSGTATWTPPTFTDNCSSAVTVTSSHNPGDTFPVGTTTVTYTATDSLGNVATCTFDVTIEDNELPTVTNCPSDIISCSGYITWVPPVFADNCTNNLSIVSNYTPGANFPVGNTTVTYTATDAAGNVVTCSFTVTRSAITLTPVSTLGGCNGASSATATVIVTGGVAPYTFNWGTNGADSLITGLVPGMYNVTVTDAAGCSATASIEIIKYVPINIVAASSKNPNCGYADGSISTTTTGGIEPYTYLWNNGATTANINNLAEGTYNVVVTDVNGCTDSLSVPLDCVFERIPQLVTPNGDGHNDVWEIPGMEKYPDAVVEIYNRWGNLVYKASPYLNNWGGYSERTTDVGSGKLPAGTYFYVIQLNPGEKAMTGYLELQY
jgi:gliding motility-associated-like protein